MIRYERQATFPERMEEALKLRNMKASELSVRSGINAPSISCYLKGKYEPKNTALYKMAKALDVAEMWLAGYDVPMERSLQQKENDALADLTDRLINEKEFRQLILKIDSLNPERLTAIKNFIDAFYRE